MRRPLKWTLWLVAAAVVAAVALAAVWFAAGRRELPRSEACPVVSNVLGTISRVFAADGDCLRLDVRKLSCAEFARVLDGVSAAATLWTPGNGDWLIVGAEHGSSNTLERVMDAFAEEDTAYTLAEVFGNCVGTVGEVLPAFDALAPDDGVLPELFVPKAVPAFDWLADGDVDQDILEPFKRELRSMQVIRRLVLEGNILSRAGKEDEAIDRWSAAYRRTHNDTLLLERLHHLRKNGEVFYRIGKFGMAAKCFETLVRIVPDDRIGYVNLAECLGNLGKKDLAAAAASVARKLKEQQSPPSEKKRP